MWQILRAVCNCRYYSRCILPAKQFDTQADGMPTEVVFYTSHPEIPLHTVARGSKGEHEAQNTCPVLQNRSLTPLTS